MFCSCFNVLYSLYTYKTCSTCYTVIVCLHFTWRIRPRYINMYTTIDTCCTLMFVATASPVIGATHRHDVILMQNLVQSPRADLFWNAKQEKLKGAAAGVRWKSDVDLIWFFFFFKSRATTQSKMFYMKNPSLRKKIWKKRKILMQLCNSFSTGHALLFLLSLLREKKIAAHLFASSIICLYNIRRSRDDLLLLLPFFYWPFLSYTQ
jgi:hypothetical protein